MKEKTQEIETQGGVAHCAEDQLVSVITPVLQIMQLNLCAKGLWLLLFSSTALDHN